MTCPVCGKRKRQRAMYTVAPIWDRLGFAPGSPMHGVAVCGTCACVLAAVADLYRTATRDMMRIGALTRLAIADLKTALVADMLRRAAPSVSIVVGGKTVTATLSGLDESNAGWGDACNYSRRRPRFVIDGKAVTEAVVAELDKTAAATVGAGGRRSDALDNFPAEVAKP